MSFIKTNLIALNLLFIVGVSFSQNDVVTWRFGQGGDPLVGWTLSDSYEVTATGINIILTCHPYFQPCKVCPAYSLSKSLTSNEQTLSSNAKYLKIYRNGSIDPFNNIYIRTNDNVWTTITFGTAPGSDSRVQLFSDGSATLDLSTIVNGGKTITDIQYVLDVSLLNLCQNGPASTATRSIYKVALLDNASNVLSPGTELAINASVYSNNANYHLKFQSDGNLVLYEGSNWIGQTHTYDHTPQPNRCVMQPDGNLVLYNGTRPVWNSQTWTYPHACLFVNDDRSICIKDMHGNIIWQFNGYKQVFPGYEFGDW